MNPSNKDAMEVALNQPQILKDCTENPFTSIALSNTNSKYFNLSNKLKTTAFIEMGGDDFDDSGNNEFCIYEDQVSGVFFGITFKDHDELTVLVDSIPTEWYDSVTMFCVILIDLHPSSDSIGIYYILGIIFTNIFAKLTNSTKFCIILNDEQVWRNNPDHNFSLVGFDYGEILLMLLHTMESDKIKEINLSYYGIRTTTYLFSNNMNEETIKNNFPKLKEISFDIDLVFQDDISDYDECHDAIEKSSNIFLKPKALYNTHAEHLPVLMRMNKLLGGKFKDTKILFHINNFMTAAKTFEVENGNDNCNLCIALDLDIPEILNLLLSKENEEKCKMNLFRRKLFKSSFFKNLFSFNVSELCMMSSTVPDLCDEKVCQFKKSICLFSPFLTTLIIDNIGININDIGKKLAAAYPRLTKMILHINEYNQTYDSYDNDFFVPFTKLEILSLYCLKYKEFEYPPSLRILEITCVHHRQVIPEPEIGDIKQLRDIKANMINDDSCLCYKRKQSLNSCVVKYSFNKVSHCIHYNMKKDLHLFGTEHWDQL